MKKLDKFTLPRYFFGLPSILILAACAPTATYHWELARPRADANLVVDRAECRGYSEQFRQNTTRPAQPISPAVQQPEGKRRQLYTDNSAVYGSIASASESLSNSYAESNRIEGIYQGCMARLGWVLVQDTTVK